jgi:hypothetical protein
MESLPLRVGQLERSEASPWHPSFLAAQRRQTLPVLAAPSRACKSTATMTTTNNISARARNCPNDQRWSCAYRAVPSSPLDVVAPVPPCINTRIQTEPKMVGKHQLLGRWFLLIPLPSATPLAPSLLDPRRSPHVSLEASILQLGSASVPTIKQ